MREIGWTLRATAVREIARQGRTLGRALIGAAVQNAMLVGGFLVLAQLTGFGGTGLRGDLLAYLLAGVFLFNLHAKAMSAAMSSADALPAGRLYHTDPLIQATGGAIGAAYLQLVSAAGLILAYHALVSPIEAAMTAPLPLLAASWISGLGIGLVLLRIKARAPGLASMAAMGWMRVGMVTSGAMFVANALPGAFLAWVTWSPIFHAVDQARGLAFANYVARHSEAWPAYAFAALAILVGLVANRAKRGPGTGV